MGTQNSLKKYIQNNPPSRTGGFLEAVWPDVYYEPKFRICNNCTSNIEATLHFKTRKPHTANMLLGFVRIIKLRCWTMTKSLKHGAFAICNWKLSLRQTYSSFAPSLVHTKILSHQTLNIMKLHIYATRSRGALQSNSYVINWIHLHPIKIRTSVFIWW
jgi:hypothetical protein